MPFLPQTHAVRMLIKVGGASFPIANSTVHAELCFWDNVDRCQGKGGHNELHAREFSSVMLEFLTY